MDDLDKTLENIDIINKAIRVATIAHQGQVRKGTDLPYVAHSYGVAMLMRRYTDSAEVIIVCLLHDVLEDVKPTIYNEAKMREDFGEDVVNLVKLVSEPKTAGEPQKPWRERKEAYLKQLADTDDKRAVMICCADKICNLRDMLEDYEKTGEEFWNRFNAGKEEILWYHEQCLAHAQGNVPEEMYEIFKQTVDQLRSIVEEKHGSSYGKSPYDAETTRKLKELGVDIFETEVPAE